LPIAWILPGIVVIPMVLEMLVVMKKGKVTILRIPMLGNDWLRESAYRTSLRRLIAMLAARRRLALILRGELG
jgi:hypothetical protein